jgi:hypothetical protein
MLRLKKKSKLFKIAKQEIRNQKNNDRNENSYKLEDNSKVLHGQCEFQEDEKKKKKRGKKVSPAINHATTNSYTAPKERGHNNTFNDTMEEDFGCYESLHALSKKRRHLPRANHFLFFYFVYLFKYQIDL